MGFFSAVSKFFQRLFGLGAGALDNAGDKILTANEGTIRAQFRKVREKLLKSHSTVRTAVANLMAINEDKKQEIKDIEKKIQELETKKLGAVRKYNETKDEKYQDAFKQCHIQLQRLKEKMTENDEFVKQTSINLDKYKRQLMILQDKIEDLKAQEDHAIADIMSSRQVTKLNEMLAGFSTDVDMQGIAAIEEARKKSIAQANLSNELSKTSKREIDEELLAAGSDVDEEFVKLLAEEEKKMLKSTDQERNL